ncbi:NADH dehydrogenase subunit A [Spirosomataceae bacterium TFI 002]|nr:NADH dehydrogenase subunit A [Spirosomataceae bacterium TFI 002]
MIHSQFAYIFLFVAAGLVMLTVILFIARLLRPNRPNKEKLTSYESGEDTVGDAIIGFKSKYYIVALVFILFEVELVLLFPWSTVFGNQELVNETKGTWGWFSIAEMFIFIFVLAVGLVYVWAQGHLDWIKPQKTTDHSEGVVPLDMYEQINKKYQ